MADSKLLPHFLYGESHCGRGREFGAQIIGKFVACAHKSCLCCELVCCVVSRGGGLKSFLRVVFNVYLSSPYSLSISDSDILNVQGFSF